MTAPTNRPSNSNCHCISSAAAAVRLDRARAFVSSLPPSVEVLVVAASRGAADDFARTIAIERGATVGIHRFSMVQLAAQIAAAPLAANGVGPSSTLGADAVASRAVFEAERSGALDYFGPVARFPGFPRALVSTLREIRGALLSADALASAPRVGADLAALLENFDDQFAAASAVDRAELFRVATEETRQGRGIAIGRALLLLDVPCDAPVERDFARALLGACSPAFVIIPAGDDAAHAAFADVSAIEELRESSRPASDLHHLRQHLFRGTQPDVRELSGDLKWFSAPGEGRECSEIARFILTEARDAVRFDEMAILLRAPQRYHGLLEHALSRAGIPAWFDRGTRRPHPAGRAFLALLKCAAEGLSASRFAEYLSLGQVPRLEADESRLGGGPARQSLPDDELLAPIATGSVEEDEGSREDDSIERDDQADAPDAAVVSGTLRAPWKWERLLVESAVIGGADRWRKRLDGLDREYRLNAKTLAAKDPDDPRLERVHRDLENLKRLREFALPLIESLASWPTAASWGEWLRLLESLAPQVLRRPDEVLRILADLRPMDEIGPVSLDEIVHVLSPRLLAIESDSPRQRYGRVFVGSPHQARGRAFRVVFVPGLAERMFPQRLTEDPLLIDDIRRSLNSARRNSESGGGSRRGSKSDGAGLSVEADRAITERLLLRLAAGAATERLYVSYPRIDSTEARERVPSFYALEMMRATTGALPGPEELRRAAAAATDASLAWPAPKEPELALDDFEHDLAVLAPLLKTSNPAAVRGHARYLIRLSDTLQRSVTSRWLRWEKAWSPADGIIRVTAHVKDALSAQRLIARPYSLSALQQFADCPYRFLISAIHRLEPFEAPQPLDRLDPLTKGSLVHRIQAEFFRALQSAGELPLRREHLGRTLQMLERVVDDVAAEYADDLAPAIDRVWRDEIDAIRSDLREWAERLSKAGDNFDPEFFEFAFGLATSPDAGAAHDPRDPHSRSEPVKIAGRFLLRGSVDLVERRRGTRERRVTDHKTGKNRTTDGMVVGGGRVLQPVLYGLVVEEALGDPVVGGRLSYCTAAGGFTTRDVDLNAASRRAAIEVLEIVDRAIETGFLVAAPNERACEWCDFHVICGPGEQRRVARKPPQRLSDLAALRDMP